LRLTKAQHLQKAEENERFAATLDTNSPVGVEWAITIKFYVALHYIRAYLASIGQNYFRQESRGDAIQRDSKICNAYDDYRELYDIARDARYDFCNLTKGHLKFADDCLNEIKAVIKPYL
jgi:hypothetical protein